MLKTIRRTVLAASLSLSLSLSLGVSGSPALAYDGVRLAPFPDVSAGDWSEESIYLLVSLGVMNGYPDGTVRPDGNVTREAFLSMFAASRSLPPGSTRRDGFPADVAADRWSHGAIRQAYDAGAIDFMIDNGVFSPSSDMTREEVAAVAGRALLLQLPEAERAAWAETGWREEERARAFPDRAAIRQDIAPYVYYAAHRGVMTGDPASGFRPADTLTRKEAAAIVRRLIDLAVSDEPLETVGFYAISSYRNADRLDAFNAVAFGWSRLKYDGPGVAALDTSETEYRVPDGFEEPLAKAGDRPKLLMMYADNAEGRLSAFLRDESAVEAFLASADAVVRDPRYGFDGVAVDFEGLLDESDREPYAAFLRMLRERLNDRSFTVAVQPTYYYKGYDLAAIGAIADRVILMAYDFTHAGSGLPSAPLPLVGDAVREALAHVPASKLTLGISKQANQWIAAPDGTASLLQPSVDRVEARAADPGTDSRIAFPFALRLFTFADDRGRHELWYEDADSMKYKVWLARYYGLRGISFWHVGHLTEADWRLIESLPKPSTAS